MKDYCRLAVSSQTMPEYLCDFRIIVRHSRLISIHQTIYNILHTLFREAIQTLRLLSKAKVISIHYFTGSKFDDIYFSAPNNSFFSLQLQPLNPQSEYTC